MIAIACHCGQYLQADDAYAGRQVRCPFCGLVLHVPAGPAPQTQSMQQAIETPRPPQAVQHPVASNATPWSARHEVLQAEQKFSHYTIRRRIGAGAMGEVWLAFDPALERELAIKIMPPQLGADEERLLRFFREARLAARLNHPHAVTIYQVGVEEGLPFLAMELVDGGSLEELVRQNGPLDWRRATQIIRDAAAGLAQAHAMGLVHRDIKPANLLCTSQGVTKVADFGLARTMSEENSLTRDGMSLGTPAYMAPELWKGQPADARSDLYSLVCTYYFLLTGRPPFEAPSVPALGYLHSHEPFPDARQFRPDLIEGIAQILAYGSQKSPNLRYQTAGELIAALDALLESRPPAPISEPALPVIVAPAPARRIQSTPPRPFTRWQLACAALTLLLAVGGVASLLWFGRKDSSPTASDKMASAATVPSRVIPADAAYFGGDAYKFFPEQLTWKEAKARCEAMGGHLVVIEYTNENQFVSDLVQRAGWRDCWIGITDEASEGQWRTVLGQPLSYTNWFANQPNNKQGAEHFALMSNQTLTNPLAWTWSDQPNHSIQHQPGFVCEWEKPGSAESAGMTGNFAVTGIATVPPGQWQPMEMTANSARPSTEGWSVGSELIVCSTSRSGYLRTRSQYYNFIVELEYQLPRAGNSGILVRAQDNGEAKPACMEIQLLEETNAFPPETRTGAIHDVVAPRFTPARPAGEWNKLKIHCEGEQVAVWINDIEVLDVKMFDFPQLQSRPRSGFIALYNWEGRANGAQFRNIRITELK